MKHLVWGVVIVLGMVACGGNLTDEQRKRLREGMENQKIVRVSDSEIVSASLDRGKEVYAALEKVKFERSKADSIALKHKVKIRWVIPGSGNAMDVENQLIEAYVLGATTGAIQDNVQKLRTGDAADAYDSLLYSKPVVIRQPDGVDKLEGVWNIYLSKKEIVLGISRK